MEKKSSLGIKYPTNRDYPLHTGSKWLEGKRADDGAEGLWRIHNNLYDLKDFIKLHPGGTDWIELTEGTDITEAYETHHLTELPHQILPKYFVRKAKAERNSPFTFFENGFYMVLKKHIIKTLATIPKNAKNRSKAIADLLLGSYIIAAILAAYKNSYSVGMLSGICLSLTSIAAHNFFHQKDNFRMYYFNFTLMQSKKWRISHALSHHLYTNTINDLEISVVEPFLNYLPSEKYGVLKYVQWIISPLIYFAIFFGELVKSIVEQVLLRETSLLILLPFTIMIPMMVSSSTIIPNLVMFCWIQAIASLHFGCVGLNAAHHHPDIFHDGDCPRPQHERDWGIHQMDCVMDRKDITGSHFLVLTNFGDHALHHLFPTIDHGLLEYLYPTFLKICADFGIEWKFVSQMELVKGQFKQLIKEKGKLEPPPALKKPVTYS